MSVLDFTVEPRSLVGKSANRKLRASGLTPAVFYASKSSATSLAFSEHDIRKLLRGHAWAATLFKLKCKDSNVNDKTVRIKERVLHPVTRHWVHVDFMEVSLTEKMEVTVPLHFEGKCIGVEEGGLLQPIHREIVIKVIPTDIPRFIGVDITNVDSNSPVHFSDVVLPDGIELISNPEDAVVTVTSVAEEEVAPVVAAPEEGEAAAEGDAKEGATSDEPKKDGDS